MKANRPYNLNDKLGFGKYRHQQLLNVLENDANYIYWCLNNIPDFELSEEAMLCAKKRSPLFVAIKSKYNYEWEPYADGIDILTTFPWKKQYRLYMRTVAEDAQILPTLSISSHTQIPIQLSLW